MKSRTLLSRSILYFLILIFVSSCATHQGYLSSNAVIINTNFKIVGLGVGESKSVRVLGFGGLKKDALVFDAKNNLYENAELKSGQALTNITVDFKRSFYPIFSKTKVTVTGEIVDFNSNNDNQLPNNYGFMGRNGYKVGEQVYIKLNGVYEKREIEQVDLKELQIESSRFRNCLKFIELISY